MLQNAIQPIAAEDLPAEEFQFVKAQQSIYELCQAIEQDVELKSQLETAKSPDNFLKVAAENGYEFTASDLEFAMRWALEKTELNTDEYDDYELSEEDLEAVAGGTVARRNAYNNSYWHKTGILVNQQCFHLTNQSAEGRSQIGTALQTMEVWLWQGNGTVKLIDLDGKYGSYEISGMAYDGLALGLLQPGNNDEVQTEYSSGHLTNILL